MYHILFLCLLSMPIMLMGASGKPQRFVEVEGTKFHVEELGSGEPMVVVHGGTQSSDDMRTLIQPLSKHYRVFAIDSRAHGLSEGDFRDVSYAQELEDLVAVTEVLGLSSFHYAGHSDGAIVGIMLAQQHPERLRSLTAISGNVHHTGVKAGVSQWLATASEEQVPPALKAGFSKRSDRPGSFAQFWKHMSQLWLSSPKMSMDSLSAISTPTLYVFADSDTISLSHAVEMFEATPQAKLLIVPGATHDVATMDAATLESAILAHARPTE